MQAVLEIGQALKQIAMWFKLIFQPALFQHILYEVSVKKYNYTVAIGHIFCAEHETQYETESE